MTSTSPDGPPIDMRLCSRNDSAFDHAWQYYLALASGFPERRSAQIPGTHAPRPRVPTGAQVRLAVENDSFACIVCEGDGFAAAIMAFSEATTVEVAADSATRAEELAKSMRANTAHRVNEAVDVTLWRYNGQNAMSWSRRLAAPSWRSIVRNYPPSVAEELSTLMSLTSIAGTGRLILWTGDPGTGKTSAIRALLRSWHSWCRGQLVADPERFFGDASYLLEVMSSPSVRATRPRLDADDEGVARWNLVVCEDADDFIRADTRRHTGAGVGRLLNLADGLLGQGLNTVVLLTSNTPIKELDPALLRPGRCLANMAFARFSATEARVWLGDPAKTVPAGGLTLAELYERSGELTRYGKTEPDPVRVGAYL
jgi:hypothetical protein